MKIHYKDWNPQADTRAIIEQAEDIINEYDDAGYKLTLRQLYYQFVARGILENTERSYKNLGSYITNARMAGMISWYAIEDRNRTHYGNWYDEDEQNAIDALPQYVRFDRWDRQDYYVEVMVEKEALGGIIAKACRPLLVPYMSCKGYLSASEAWRAGQRFQNKLEEGKQCVLIHLGDHDPSGIDMTRDNDDRINMFANTHTGVDVRRIALNMYQVEEYSPPPNPAKITDSRAEEYIRRYGRSSWELDALEPQVMEKLIQDEVGQFIDQDSWDEVGEEETAKRSILKKLAENWDDIKRKLEDEY